MRAGCSPAYKDLLAISQLTCTGCYPHECVSEVGDSRSSSLEDLPPADREPAAEDVDRVSRIDAASVMTALQTVDETFRAPLTLFYIEDMSYQEIADALEVPIGTVMSRLSRGKAQLRTALETAEAPASKVLPFPGAKGAQAL